MSLSGFIERRMLNVAILATRKNIQSLIINGLRHQRTVLLEGLCFACHDTNHMDMGVALKVGEEIDC